MNPVVDNGLQFLVRITQSQGQAQPVGNIVGELAEERQTRVIHGRTGHQVKEHEVHRVQRHHFFLKVIHPGNPVHAAGKGRAGKLNFLAGLVAVVEFATHAERQRRLIQVDDAFVIQRTVVGN